MRSAVLASLLVLSLFLAGCGEGSSSKDKNTVDIWVHTSSESAEGEVIKDTVDRFNEEYEGTYQAEIQFIPRGGGGGGYEDKVNAAVSTGTLPDVLTLDGPNTAAYAEAEIIAPLGEYISNKEDLLDSIINQGTYNGKLYAVGYSESGVGIYYNKEMFKEAGIDMDALPTIENPWDWERFMELSKKLTETYEVPAIDMMLNSQNEWLMYAFTPFIWSNDGQVISDEGNALGHFNSEKTMEALNFVQEMLNKGYTTLSPSENGFLTGKYPMLMSGSWTIQQIEANYDDLEYGIMPYPTSPETHDLVSPSGSWQYAMTSDADNKEAAGALIDFMTTTEAMVDISLGNGVLPARHSAAEELEGQVSPQMSTLIEQNTASAHPRPIVPAYPQVTRAFQQTLTGLAYYETTEEMRDLLDQKAREMQTAIDRRN